MDRIQAITRSFASYWLVAILATPACAEQSALPDENVSTTTNATPAAGNTLYGFIPFPYDLTLAAINNTYRIAEQNSTLYVQHRDNGIPWQEALDEVPFPEKVRNDWADYAHRRPAGRKVYLGLAPLAEDRISLIHASEGSRTPNSFLRKPLDDDDVKRAYLNYVLRAIENFQPDYLNLGVEVGELAAREPGDWSQFENLYDYVRRAIKKRYPNIQIGISFGLQSLMLPEVAERARKLVEASDYLCLSFYPYMSEFHERFGAEPLSAPPDEWREPLAWVRRYTNKSIALCETGYNSQVVSLDEYDLAMRGSKDLQAEYVRDLGRIASRDDYLFVVWFLPVDYQKLFEKLKVGEGVQQLWEYNGLLDQNLNPKPALSEWQHLVGKTDAEAPATTAPSSTPKAFAVGFATKEDLFIGSRYDRLNLVADAPPQGSHSMHWRFDYKKGRFQWAMKNIPQGSLGEVRETSFWLKSDRNGPILLQLKESNGEAFYVVLQSQSQWTEVRLSLSDFQLDNNNQRDGSMQADLFNEILIADPGAVSEDAEGRRQVWISQWSFK